MIRLFDDVQGADDGAPRVSGDDPNSYANSGKIGACSPRERG